MSRYSLTRKYRATFFIFPAFFPLIELLPWFLTLLGALAGATQLISKAVWRRKKLRWAVLLISLICFAAAGALVWQRYRVQPAAAVGSELTPELPRLEAFPPQTAPRPLPVHVLTPLTELWSVPAEQNLGKPLVKDGVLLIGTLGGTFDAFATADGHRLWTLHKNEPVFTPPATAGKQVFIGEGHHTSAASGLTALSFPDGKPQWSRIFRSHLESYPAVDEAEHRLWQGGGATGLWALDSRTGESLWWNPLGHIDVPPLFRDGQLFAVAKLKEDADGTALFALDAANGKVLWSVPLEGNTMGSLLPGVDGRLFVSTALGQVGVVRHENAGWAHAVTMRGEKLWTARLPTMPLPEGAILRDGSLFFYALQDGQLAALRTADGAIAWREQIGPALETDVALIEDVTPPLIAAVAADGTVSIRDAVTGQERHRFTVESGDSNPLYADGVLYIATPTRIHAYAGFGVH